jgi:hypothetical protein
MAPRLRRTDRFPRRRDGLDWQLGGSCHACDTDYHRSPCRPYSYAAPGIRKIYPDTESFFEMVRKGYEPVYRPDNFAFGRSKTLPEGVIVQEVLISGAEGEDWTALYAMEKQPDGSFKIRGVQMVKYAAPET